MAESFNELFDDPKESNSATAHITPQTPIRSPEIPATSQPLEFIFCSECGQKIKSNSKFCRFCGSKVDAEDDVTSNSSKSLNVQSIQAESQHVQEHNINTPKPIDVKIKSESTVKKSTVADEIVANLKMIGIALIIWVIYIIGFVCYRAKDVTPLTETNSYYGESCYDPGIMTGSWEFSWEKHLATKINYISTKKNKYGFTEFNPMSTSDYLFLSNLTPERALEEAKRQAKSKKISDEEFSRLTQEAKEDAKRERDSFNDEITSIRQSAYEDELHQHMLWAAIIALGIMIIGRYFILACKWVSNNKSE